MYLGKIIILHKIVMNSKYLTSLEEDMALMVQFNESKGKNKETVA